jgi:hypothetical protein
MKNLLIGAISSNYSINDIKVWVESSNFEGVERALLVYNGFDKDVIDYLKQQNVSIIPPHHDFWGNSKTYFESNTGVVDLSNSYSLIHNIRFLHIWGYLSDNSYEKVFITDVKDVYFNLNPFDSLEENKLTATSEIITYNKHQWNKEHLFFTLGTIGYSLLINEPVLNVGVFGGDYKLVRDICADIYLISTGKAKVADQTSFNYLINTKYRDVTNITTDLAAHLHVVNEGLVDLDLNTLSNYKIVHQYDRIDWLKRQVFNNYSL